MSSTLSVPPSGLMGMGSSSLPCSTPKLVEHPQGFPREVAQLRVGSLGLELGDHHDRQHDLMLAEPAEGARVGEQDIRVENVGAGGALGSDHVNSSRTRLASIARSWLSAGPGRFPRARSTPAEVSHVASRNARLPHLAVGLTVRRVATRATTTRQTSGEPSATAWSMEPPDAGPQVRRRSGGGAPRSRGSRAGSR